MSKRSTDRQHMICIHGFLVCGKCPAVFGTIMELQHHYEALPTHALDISVSDFAQSCQTLDNLSAVHRAVTSEESGPTPRTCETAAPRGQCQLLQSVQHTLQETQVVEKT